MGASRKASEIGEPEGGVEETSASEGVEVEPSSALGRMQTAARNFERFVQRGFGGPRKTGGG